MKKEDPRTRKLSEIKETEGIVPFLLSIFRGEANINEKVGSKLLAEKYFDDVYRAGDPTAPLLLQRQQRFRCLVVLGASTRSIVRKYYQDMIASIRKRLDTLTMALECPELFEGRTVLLKGLLQRLKALAEIIDGSGLLGDDPEEGDTLDKFKPARPPVSRAELDRTIYLADRWSFLLDILLWSPSTSAGLQAKPVRLGLLRELRQHLAETIEAITDSGLTEGIGEVPMPWEIQIEQNRLLAEVNSITGSPEGDFMLMLERMKEMNDKLERDEHLEESDFPFDLFG